mgnify:CR=1 FL=1
MASRFCTILFVFILLSINYCTAQFDELCSEYDILTTIAGKGDFDNRGINGWLQEYEGGPATEAELSRPHMAMADAAGNIGYYGAGKVHLRKSGSGIFPVPGWTGEYDWTGYIPFEDMTHLYNPEGGMIVTPNSEPYGSG